MAEAGMTHCRTYGWPADLGLADGLADGLAGGIGVCCGSSAVGRAVPTRREYVPVGSRFSSLKTDGRHNPASRALLLPTTPLLVLKPSAPTMICTCALIRSEEHTSELQS